MLARTRLGAVTVTILLAATSFGVLLAAPASATSGRDSTATAYDATLGPFLGATGGGSPFVNANPLAEDWYKLNVIEGEVLQVALFGYSGGRVTVYHSAGCGATSCPDEIIQIQIPNDCGGLGLADVDLLIWQTELVYIRISPSGMLTGNQPYNLAVRAYNPTEIRAGESVTSVPGNESIHGWAIPVLLAGSCGGGGGTIWLPMQFVTDYYWINVSDAVGPNHQSYRAQLSWTCQTAIFDLFVYQIFDPLNQDTGVTLLNHSLGYQRRENRAAASTIPAQLDFAPVLYDGKYLAVVSALENGSFSLSGPADRFTYTVGVTSIAGYPRDSNDRVDSSPWVNTSQKVNGRIDGRDDNGDYYRFSLVQGDQVTMGISLFRENNEITTWGQRYKVVIYDPNGTAIYDDTNWGFAGGWYFNPYLTVPSFTAAMNGTYSLLLQTADGGLIVRMGNNQPQLTGYTGRNWADYEINFALPNRRPVQLQSPLPDVILNEDGSGTINLGAFFMDPEGKFGYPTFGVGTSQNFTFSLDSTGKNLTATPKADYFGRDVVTITVRDDVPANSYPVQLNLVVDPVNDAPRIYSGAAANWSMVGVPEDAETTVPLRAIFYDIDDIDLEFAAGGVSGGHLDVLINNVSKIVTITPQPNWNGCQDITWTASDPGSLTSEFQTTVCADPLNDPPRSTDRRLDRIVFNEGGQYTLDLSGEFYDLDIGDTLYYYGVIDDPIVAQFVRINNSLLTPTDPYMRIYVLDAVRADYFTDGPVQVRFFVLDRPLGDPMANFDPSVGAALSVEKTTFLEILNVNDAPLLDAFTPTPEEVINEPRHEGETITFSVTDMKDADHEQQFFYKWFVNDDEVAQEVSPTFVFRTVLDKTRPGQYDAGNYTVRVQVFDASGAKAIVEPTWSFEILKLNREPTVTVLRPTSPTFEEGTFIDFQALATDEDPEDSPNLETTWTFTDAAGRTQTVSSTDRVRKLLDPGVYQVTVSAFDGTARTNSTITVTVTEHALNTPGFDLSAALAGLGLAAAMAAGANERRRRK